MFTVIPCSASSSAITFVSRPSPPFAAQYAEAPESHGNALRPHSQRNGRKLVNVAEAVVESHLLLLPKVLDTTDGDTGKA